MKPKNHEILGRNWPYHRSLADSLQYWEQTSSRLGMSPAGITHKLIYPALHHLGFGPLPEGVVQAQVNKGVDLAIEYFTGDWWKPEGIDRLYPGLEPATRQSVIENCAMTMDKSHPNRKLKWFEATTSALFLGGLTQRWIDVASIGSWFEPTIEPEYQAGEIEDEYQLLFVCIAGSLVPHPMDGADELLARVKKCRTKRPRLLCAAWESAMAVEQSAFNKAFSESVNHFLSKPGEGQVHAWLATHQSAVWFIAEQRGLTFPNLSETQRAAVMTRQSVGLSD